MDDREFAHRELCPDEMCIGVIGPDGRCKECGRVSPRAVTDPRNLGLTAANAGSRPDELDDLDGDEDADPDELDDDEAWPDSGADEEESEAGDEDDRDDEPDDLDDDDQDEPGAAALESAPDDFAERRLCSDGACIGVVGPDGKCRECGKVSD